MLLIIHFDIKGKLICNVIISNVDMNRCNKRSVNKNYNSLINNFIVPNIDIIILILKQIFKDIVNVNINFDNSILDFYLSYLFSIAFHIIFKNSN